VLVVPLSDDFIPGQFGRISVQLARFEILVGLSTKLVCPIRLFPGIMFVAGRRTSQGWS
jgi:hypothetical protein